MKKIVFLALLLIVFRISTYAQDFHYSQTFYSPITSNPGNTGVFNGDIRAYTIYRMQWFTITKPYKTFSIAIDAPIFKKKMRGDDFFAAGINFNNDNIGSPQLKTNTYNGLLSFTKYLGGKKNHNVTIGFEGGYATRTVSVGDFVWDSQYDSNTGTNNPAIASGEPGSGAISFFDMSTGLVWNFNNDRKLRSALGFSVHHFTAPNISINGGADKLLPKYSFQWNINYQLKDNGNAILQPNIYIAQQGTTLLLNVGTNVKYLLQEASRYTDFHTEKSLSIGAFYRLRDALFVDLRLDYGNIGFAVAYDINVSGLTPVSHTVGGFEFMLQYRGLFSKNKNPKRTSVRFL